MYSIGCKQKRNFLLKVVLRCSLKLWTRVLSRYHFRTTEQEFNEPEQEKNMDVSTSRLKVVTKTLVSWSFLRVLLLLLLQTPEQAQRFKWNRMNNINVRQPALDT